jgi:uncharacterized membrane protein YcaP (DUF421 family)
MWFDSWESLVRVMVGGAVAYAFLVFLLRVSGKRTLSKLNAFDLVVTVALGSTLATVLLSKDVAVVDGLAAFAVLVLGQYAISTLAVRSRRVRQLVKSEPRMLLYRGELSREAMRRERITPEEIESVVRGAGLSSTAEAAAVILETDGSFHVLAELGSDCSALNQVRGFRAGPDSQRGGLRRQHDGA